MTGFHVHLISDATGETLTAVARACLVQFDGVEVSEHLWPLIRSSRQLSQVVAEVAADPGIVLYTLVDEELRRELEAACAGLGVASVAILDPVIAALGSFLGKRVDVRPGQQHEMDEEYFARIDAMSFVLSHDDGQAAADLDKADVILVGVSRTSKTPTCIYLANRGMRAANVPYVPGCPLPDELLRNTGTLIVGLTESPARLAQVRRNRLRTLGEVHETDYTDPASIREETAAARRLFEARNWPVIDVTRRSIEETAAAIMALHQQRQRSRPE